jgi:diaminohydroxyphosphoribosylaminopyrimidine deaminase/5-amino-6-(5-phosphoribosylamino)uracil reductase
MDHMDRALSLARRALGSVSPNPAVGAVIVRDGVVVGEGWTQPPGQAHAEAVALRQAGEKAAGAVLYTTLEPCCYQGRTPPCVRAIVDAGVSEVRAAMMDPNPQVSGNGLSQLDEAGIKTLVGEGEEEARKLMEAYLKFITTGLPFVTAKFAMSLDGRIATRAGDSKWITGVAARRYGHGLRATSDAIMAGINTIAADDPQLTARDDSGRPLERQPLRVVVDSRGRLSEDARLLLEPGRTLVAVADVDSSTRGRLEGAGAEVEHVPAGDGSVDLAELVRRLGAERDITSLLVEGGGALMGSLFDRGLVDKVVAIVAPTIIGGRGAVSPVGGVGVETMADALRLERVEVLRFGGDLAIVGYR